MHPAKCLKKQNEKGNFFSTYTHLAPLLLLHPASLAMRSFDSACFCKLNWKSSMQSRQVKPLFVKGRLHT